MRPLLALALLPALLAAGCVDAPEDVEAAAASEVGLPPATPQDVPFSWDGTFTPGAVACPVVTCVSLQVEGVYSDLSPSGTISGAKLEMTWQPTSPNTETLRLGLGWGEDGFEYVEGTSPLLLEVRGLDIAPSDDPYVWAWIPTSVPMGAATALTPQDFHVEGTIAEQSAPLSAEA